MLSIRRTPTCHPDRKYHSKGLCASCAVMAWQQRHPERVRCYARRISRKVQLARYGLTLQQYEFMWRGQGGRCGNRACTNAAPLAPANYRRALLVDYLG